MIILKEQIQAQTINFIPRKMEATTIVIRNETTKEIVEIDAEFVLNNYYLQTTNIFNLKENTFYNLKVLNNNEIVYLDKIFCTSQNNYFYTADNTKIKADSTLINVGLLDDYVEHVTTNKYKIYE